MLLTAATAEPIHLYAAGSLRAALTDVASAFVAESGGRQRIATTFGASGLLREGIEAGAVAHVFASADTGHPQRLAAQGRAAAPVRVFARNQLCALLRDGLSVGTEGLLDLLLDANVRLGTSTPKADPSGDYAFALFAKADALKPGAKARLQAKALQLTGGAPAAAGPEARSPYAAILRSGQADVFLTYSTNAVAAKAEAPGLSIVRVPSALDVGADYGLLVLADAPAAAADLARYIVGGRAQAMLRRYGFGPGDPP